MTNPAHIHLILNHIPVVGIGLGSILLLLAFVPRWRVLGVSAALLFVLSAVATIPVYLSGEAGEEQLEDLLKSEHDRIETHDEVAHKALYSSALLGLVSLGALFQAKRQGHLSRVMLLVLLIFSQIDMVLMGVAAGKGGEIRHPEARPEFEVTPSQSSS